MEDQGWYECRVLYLDRHSPEEDFANGSWVHLTVNCMRPLRRWWRREGREMTGTQAGGKEEEESSAAAAPHPPRHPLFADLAVISCPSFRPALQFFKSTVSALNQEGPSAPFCLPGEGDG